MVQLFHRASRWRYYYFSAVSGLGEDALLPCRFVVALRLCRQAGLGLHTAGTHLLCTRHVSAVFFFSLTVRFEAAGPVLVVRFEAAGLRLILGSLWELVVWEGIPRDRAMAPACPAG